MDYHFYSQAPPQIIHAENVFLGKPDQPLTVNELAMALLDVIRARSSWQQARFLNIFMPGNGAEPVQVCLGIHIVGMKSKSGV